MLLKQVFAQEQRGLQPGRADRQVRRGDLLQEQPRSWCGINPDHHDIHPCSNSGPRHSRREEEGAQHGEQGRRPLQPARVQGQDPVLKARITEVHQET